MTPSLEKQSLEYLLIKDLVHPGCRVLDVGCGEGEILSALRKEKSIQGFGIEIDSNKVNICVAKGLSVVHGNAETDMGHYPDHSFDWVLLNQTIQSLQHPEKVLRQMLRIAPKGIVSFTNLGYWHYRLRLLFKGMLPVSQDVAWNETLYGHPCTSRDFEELCFHLEAEILLILQRKKGIVCVPPSYWHHLTHLEPFFLITKRELHHDKS